MYPLFPLHSCIIYNNKEPSGPSWACPVYSPLHTCSYFLHPSSISRQLCLFLNPAQLFSWLCPLCVWALRLFCLCPGVRLPQAINLCGTALTFSYPWVLTCSYKVIKGQLQPVQQRETNVQIISRDHQAAEVCAVKLHTTVVWSEKVAQGGCCYIVGSV